ncbi:hypothetical protein [Micromonospora sp. WMMD712]|uniref:hypothetical protein n=1 Tax=Micromonospora sp. WMMD712 TaxID=3016096 RepID=UPI002499C3C6|nr:hypothetical protein [Micromonospora sp. WMMD712]WFE56577.1 hypothetical protein O7633_06650 [Micromonospora sp. WMMD712]
MDLRRALDIVAQPWTYFGVSDAQLCADVQACITDELGVRDVPALDGEATVRPLDVLLRLAVATKPQYQTDLYEAHRHWSLLRYLGLFDADPDGQLCLSSAGRRIVGSQRRVTSEELGIGFAVHRRRNGWRRVGPVPRLPVSSISTLRCPAASSGPMVSPHPSCSAGADARTIC